MPKIRFPSFKDLLMSNPYNSALKLAEVAKKLLNQATIANKEEGDRKYQIFLTLVLLERSLDKYRACAPHGSAIDFRKDHMKLNGELNKLREAIWHLVDNLDSGEIRESLRQLGEDIKLRFIKK